MLVTQLHLSESTIASEGEHCDRGKLILQNKEDKFERGNKVEHEDGTPIAPTGDDGVEKVNTRISPVLENWALTPQFTETNSLLIQNRGTLNDKLTSSIPEQKSETIQ